MTTTDRDVVNPKHYDVFPGENAFSLIRASMTHEEYTGFLKGNILKYRLRAGEKGDALKDIAKANEYRKELHKHLGFGNEVQAELPLRNTGYFGMPRIDAGAFNTDLPPGVLPLREQGFIETSSVGEVHGRGNEIVGVVLSPGSLVHDLEAGLPHGDRL